jgi:exonuclease I
MIVFFDLETGGLELKHPILQIAAIATDADLRERERFECKLLFREEDAQPEALELNHYDPAVWRREALEPKEAVARFGDFLGRHRSLERVSARTGGTYRVVQSAGWNSHGFDIDRLFHLFKAHNAFCPVDRMSLDVMHLAMWHLRFPEERIKSMKLTEVAAHLGITIDVAHDALGDVAATLAVARRLLDRTAG